MITLLITIIYMYFIFQKFIEKPREFIDIYRIIQEFGGPEAFSVMSGISLSR